MRGGSSASSAATTTSPMARASRSTVPVSPCATCGPGWFTAAAVVTTLGRTTIGDWRRRPTRQSRARAARWRPPGRTLRAGTRRRRRDRRDVRQRGDARLVDLALPLGLAELMVLHGSVTVDGVSLTVNALPAPGRPSDVADRIHLAAHHASAISKSGRPRARRGRHDRQVRSARCSRNQHGSSER